ncbi:MAG: hypothetical protein ACRD3L_04135 [Terriglobales bacterium]
MSKNRIGVVLSTFLSVVISLTLTAQSARAAQFKTIDGPNAFETDCNDINNANTIVGFYIDNNGGTHGFALINNQFKTVNVPHATATLLYGLNNKGKAVGWYTDSSSVTHGFVTDAQLHVTTIDPPGSILTNAWSINDAGVIVGAYVDSSGVYHGFSLTNGTYTTYNAPGGSILTEFTGINNHGIMVGIFDDSSGVEHGFGLASGHFVQIDDPNANGVVTATDRINDSEEYVGLWGTSTSGPFSGYTAKNNHFTTVMYPNSLETRVRGLNNGGNIVGRYTDQNGGLHGFVATP